MDFDNRKVYGDTSITDGLVYFQLIANGTFSMPDHLHGPQSLNYWVTQLSSLVPKEEKVVDKEERSKTKTAQNINA